MKWLFKKHTVAFLIVFIGAIQGCRSQSETNPGKISAGKNNEMAKAANEFLKLLSETQMQKVQFSFNDDERYDWHYIPRSRKGLTFNDMTEAQKKAALTLLHTVLSDTGYYKATSIMQLEDVLRLLEDRPVNDRYRDPGNYSFSIFGNPQSDAIWGWRLEGHHVSLNFSSEDNRIVSGTPGFFGSNPAIVLSGPEKGKYILKDEAELGFELLHSLNPEQNKKAVFSNTAPGEIFTAASRKAMISDKKGISYTELNADQKMLFMQLLSIYIHRYTHSFAETMMKEIKSAGLDNLRFAWAGDQVSGVGHPHYYRIQGPTIIIEYDNTQNNANHIHSVIRDLKYDFGGDELMKHYENSAN